MTESLAKKSTTVRSSLPLRQRATRLAFGALERRAPRLGARWAERVWCTVQHADRSRSVPAAPGDLGTIPLHEGTAPTFVAEVWGTSGPVVYLLHGWGGHRSQFGAFVAPLLATGFRVVAIDAPSHGDSAPGSFGPNRSLITEFTAALAAAARAFGPAHAVIGHSLGGGCAALAVLDGLAAKRLVLISPMTDPTRFMQGFAAMLGFGDRIRSGLMRRLELRTGRPMADFDAVGRAQSSFKAEPPLDDAQLPSLLVIHDREDKQIPFGMGKAIAAAWQGAELLGTNGLGHNRILRDPEVIRSAVEFVQVGGVGAYQASVSRGSGQAA
ncbi:MAG TPA: alpha/beta hydrolase [Actinocrinis sp.]|nr:alpha/beta hydrolase [Actinocrinis sp.]